MTGNDRRVCLECGIWSGDEPQCLEYWEEPVAQAIFATESPGDGTTTPASATAIDFKAAVREWSKKGKKKGRRWR